MELYNAEQVAQRTGAPYRQILTWVDRGWIKPTMLSGKVRTSCLFNDGDVWEVAWFERIRHRFHPTEWPLVAAAIHEVRLEGKVKKPYIVGLQDPKCRKTVEYRAVGEKQAKDYLRAGALVLLIALGTVGAPGAMADGAGLLGAEVR